MGILSFARYRYKRIRERVTFAKVFLFNPNGSTWYGSNLPELSYTEKDWVLKTNHIDIAIQNLTIKDDSDPLEMAWCFNPRHMIVFYENEEKILGHIKICMECNNYAAFPSPPEKYNDVDPFAQTMLELNIPIFDEPDKYIQFFNEKGI